MDKGIVILDADKDHCHGLCSMLDERNYRAIPIHSLNNFSKLMQENSCQVLIMDLDTIPVDKSLFRKLKRTKPSMHILGISNRLFHPELEEAMSRHIYACLSKPVDEEELIFLIKSVV